LFENQQQQQQQQQQINFKLVQTFPHEHPSGYSIKSLIQINPNTLVSASSYFSDSWSFFSDNAIVIWSISKSKSSILQYEPIQRITEKEAGGGSIDKLVLIKQKKEEEEEEEFASCSYRLGSIIIWRRGKGEGDNFKQKQKLENVKDVEALLYISLTNELIFGSIGSSSSLLQIWSPSSSTSSSSSEFVERQKIEISSSIVSLCQRNKNDTSRRIEFASGHKNGKICIWSKQQKINGSNHYSSIRKLKPFNKWGVADLIFLNDKGFDCLIACSGCPENKIKIFKGEEEGKEELEHEGVLRLIPMSNGQFASGGGGDKGSLNIWSPSSSSSSS